jgi:hypothetical protein
MNEGPQLCLKPAGTGDAGRLVARGPCACCALVGRLASGTGWGLPPLPQP